MRSPSVARLPSALLLALAALLSALATPLRAQDAPEVSATLSASSVRTGETVVLQIMATTRGATPTIDVPPLPRELSVVGSRDYTEMQLSLPGGRTRMVRREIVLRATSPGEFQIPAMTVRADGVVRQTRPLSLSVSGPAALPFTTPFPAPSGSAAEVMLNVHLSADTVYVGQQLTLTTETLVSERVRVRLRRAPEYLPPNISGFWLHELPRQAVQTRAVGNQYYEVQHLGRAYFPISAGEYAIPPARLIYEVRSGFLTNTETHELASDTFRLVVLPIPEEGRPASFTGAVGRYSVQASVAPTQLAVGEPATLVLEVRGDGNIKALPPPPFPVPDGAQLYPPVETSDVRVVDGQVTGMKRFTWVIIPERAGRIELPPLEYSYFNPRERAFGVSRTQPLVLQVGGEGVAAESEPLVLRPPRPADSGLRRLAWVRSPVFAAVQLLPLLAILGALWHRSDRQRPRVTSRRALRAQRRGLVDRLAELADGDPARFLATALDDTRRWLAARLGRPELSAASPAPLGRALADHGVAAAVVEPLVTLLERVQHARFEAEPPPAGVRAVLARELARLLEEVDRTAAPPLPGSGGGGAGTGTGTAPGNGPSRRSARASSAALLLLLTGVLSTAPALGGASVQQAAATRPAAGESFAGGLAALEALNATAAVAAFSAAVLADPEHAAAWYNLGNACHAAGDRGCAVWAWLTALRVQPRLGDARQNLQVAGTPPDVIRSAVPPLPLSSNEVLFLASLAWLIGGALLVRRILQVGQRSRWPSLAIFGAGALLLASWSAPGLRRPAAVVVQPGVSLQAAPNLRAEPIRELPAGHVVRLEEQRTDGWIRVTTPQGEQGWLEEQRLRRLGAPADAAASLPTQPLFPA